MSKFCLTYTLLKKGGGGRSGGAMVLGKLPVPFLIIVGQGPTALTVGVGRGCLDIFALVHCIFSLSLSLGDDKI